MRRDFMAVLWGIWTFFAGTAFAAETSRPVEPAADHPLGLEESIRIAFQNHGDVLSSKQQLISAQQKVIVSRSSLYPQVLQSSTFQHFDQNSSRQVGANSQATGPLSQNSHDFTVQLSQTLWDNEQTLMRVRESKAGARGAEAGVELARNSVAFTVADSYYEQLRRDRLLALARQQVEQSQQHLTRIEAQIKAGTSARIDVQPVRVELRQAQFNLVQAESNALVAATNFRNALGLDRGARLSLQDVSGATVKGAGKLEDYVAVAKRTRPDLLQAETTVQRSQAAYQLAKIQSRPLVSVTTNYDLGLFDSPLDRQWTVNGALTIPIFNAGALRAEVRDAQASLQSDRIHLQQLEKNVSADVESAYLSVVRAVDSIQAAQALVEEAQQNLNAANEKYRLGLGIVLETVDAQVQLFNAQTSATSALYDYYVARATLDRAIGRWGKEQPAKQ